MPEKLILARRRVGPIQFRSVSLAIIEHWRDEHGADHVATQAALERYICKRVPVDERTVRSVLHRWVVRGLMERHEISPAAILYRLGPDVADPLWRRYCVQVESGLVEPITLAGPAGTFRLVDLARWDRGRVYAWEVPSRRFHVGAWAWAQAWQAAVGLPGTGGVGHAIDVAAMAARRGVLEMVHDYPSSLRARFQQGLRLRPMGGRIHDGVSAAMAWARGPPWLQRACLDALWTAERAAASRFLGVWPRWFDELGRRVRTHVRRAYAADVPERPDGSPLVGGPLEERLRAVPPPDRATIRRSDKAWGWPFLDSADGEGFLSVQHPL